MSFFGGQVAKSFRNEFWSIGLTMHPHHFGDGCLYQWVIREVIFIPPHQELLFRIFLFHVSLDNFVLFSQYHRQAGRLVLPGLVRGMGV